MASSSDKIELLKCLTFFSEDPNRPTSYYHHIIELFANTILKPENIHLLTDDFLNQLQTLGTTHLVFQAMLKLDIVPSVPMLDELKRLSKGLCSKDSSFIEEWIKSHPIPNTLEERLALAEHENLLLKDQLDATIKREMDLVQQMKMWESETEDELRRTIACLENVLTIANTQNSKLTSDLAKKEIQLKESENTVTELKAENEAIQSVLTQLATTCQNFDVSNKTASQMVECISTQLKEQQDINKRSQYEIEDLKRQLKEMEEQYLEAQKNKRQEHVRALEIQKDLEQNQIVRVNIEMKLQQALMDVFFFKSTLEIKTQQVAELEESLQNEKSENTTVKQTLSERDAEVAQLKTQRQDADEKYKTCIDESSAQIVALKQKLAETQQKYSQTLDELIVLRKQDQDSQMLTLQSENESLKEQNSKQARLCSQTLQQIQHIEEILLIEIKAKEEVSEELEAYKKLVEERDLEIANCSRTANKIRTKLNKLVESF